MNYPISERLLRERISELEEEVHLLREMMAPVDPELKLLDLPPQLSSMLTLLLIEDVVPLRRVIGVIERYGRGRLTGDRPVSNTEARVLVSRLRAALRHLGVNITLRIGVGYSISPADKRIIEKEIEERRSLQ
jgi:hypothetical protein